MKHEPEPETAAASEIWLKANPRPAVAMGGAMLVAAALALAAVAAFRPPTVVAALIIAAAVVDALVVAGFIWASSRPRIARRGDTLEIRLSPMAVERVPIELVECVFPGSQPLGGDDATADRRVGTLVIRLAERALDWRSRPVAAAWGAWEDGNVVFDGRWCEPLSQAVARDLSGRLFEARRRLRGDAV
jgi:hypothetical protein